METKGNKDKQIEVVPGLPPISSEQYKKISKYTWQEVNPVTFRDSETWPILKDILLYHPNPIVRHEASYIIGDFNIHDLVPALIESVKYDPSIVAKHESAEALGFIKGDAAVSAYNFLNTLLKDKNRTIFSDPLIYHEDVIVTAKEAAKLLEKEVKN